MGPDDHLGSRSLLHDQMGPPSVQVSCRDGAPDTMGSDLIGGVEPRRQVGTGLDRTLSVTSLDSLRGESGLRSPGPQFGESGVCVSGARQSEGLHSSRHTSLVWTRS